MPKPVLSDSLFNADDVATAVLSEANLQVTNNDLGVTDISSSFVFGNNYSAWAGHTCYHFNGFIFVSLTAYTAGSNLPSSDVVFDINNTDYYPNTTFHAPMITHQGDTATFVTINTNGEVKVNGPVNAGPDNYFYFAVNCFYRT